MRAILLGLASLALPVAMGSASVASSASLYDAPTVSRVEFHDFVAAEVNPTKCNDALEESASPSVGFRGTSTTPSHFIATNTAEAAATRGGESAAAASGRQMHVEFDQQLQNLSEVDPRFQPGLKSGPNRPDGFFDGKPIELKPDTPTGIRAGQSQLTRYMDAFSADTGYLVLYDTDGAFRMGQVMVR